MQLIRKIQKIIYIILILTLFLNHSKAPAKDFIKDKQKQKKRFYKEIWVS